MRRDGAAGEDDQTVRVVDEIGDDAACLGEALGGPVRRAGSVRLHCIGQRRHVVHFRPRALLALLTLLSATRGISCDCSQS